MAIELESLAFPPAANGFQPNSVCAGRRGCVAVFVKKIEPEPGRNAGLEDAEFYSADGSLDKRPVVWAVGPAFQMIVVRRRRMDVLLGARRRSVFVQVRATMCVPVR